MLDFNDLLAKGIAAKTAAEQLAERKRRRSATKLPGEKREFKPLRPIYRIPPRTGPDAIRTAREITVEENLQRDLAAMRRTAYSALAREAFLSSLLGTC